MKETYKKTCERNLLKRPVKEIYQRDLSKIKRRLSQNNPNPQDSSTERLLEHHLYSFILLPCSVLQCDVVYCSVLHCCAVWCTKAPAQPQHLCVRYEFVTHYRIRYEFVAHSSPSQPQHHALQPNNTFEIKTTHLQKVIYIWNKTNTSKIESIWPIPETLRNPYLFDAAP